ncbi:MAG: glycosyltransferase family 39 protein [Kineosporiaceae bacterium]
MAHEPATRPPLPSFAVRPVAAVAAATVAVLLLTAGRYGYHRDELYFRMLGDHPAWGYTDQPPLTPLLARASIAVLGDSVTALHVLPALLTGLTCVLAALLARELGGGRLAQTLAATAGTGAITLVSGHVLLTATADLPLWLLVELFALRALLRAQPQWWLWAGMVTGFALSNKLLVVLLLLGLGAGLLLVGPRAVLRERRLWLGVALAVLVGLPNLVYQVVEGFPQADMAAALAENKGDEARVLLVPMQLVAMGPPLAPVWIAGLVGLLRRPAWRPARAFGVGYLLICAFLLVQGGQFYYTIGLLHLLTAAGWVRVERWVRRDTSDAAGGTEGSDAAGRAHERRWRRGPASLVGAALALSVGAGLVIALPVIPADRLGDTPIPEINQAARDSIGWPAYVDQIAAAHRSLPPADRAASVVLTGNYGEAGAVDRYGPSRGLPAAYSGQNALYALGPPPESATAAVLVMQDADARAFYARMFRTCTPAATLDNGVGVDNEEQGTPVLACTGRLMPWARAWPGFRHLD